MQEIFQTHVVYNHSVKILKIRHHLPCSLSLFLELYCELNIYFVVFVLIRFMFKLVRDKVSLNVEYISTKGRHRNTLI